MKPWETVLLLSLLGAFFLITPIRISPKYIDNSVLQYPKEVLKIDGADIIFKGDERMTLAGIIACRTSDPLQVPQITGSYREPLRLEVDESNGRAYYKHRRRLGVCGTTGPFWTQLPRETIPMNERRNLAAFLVEHFYAIPSVENVGSSEPYAKELIEAFLKTAEFQKSAYDGPHRDSAEAFIAELLPTLSAHSYYNALWFYGSLHPEKLKQLALSKVEEDLKVIGRGEAYHYLKYLEFHAPEEYLNLVYQVQVNLGHDYAGDHEYYARILLKSGNWKGIDHIMKLMIANRDRYKMNGFRTTGDLCWPIARAALDEHVGEFNDPNAINSYIGKWYFENRSKIHFDRKYMRITVSEPMVGSEEYPPHL